MKLTSNLQIVQLATRFSPDRGGIETHVVELSRELLALGAQVTVITLSPAAPTTATLPSNLKITRLRVTEKNTRSWRYKWQVWQEIWRHRRLLGRATVVHAHDVAWWLVPVLPGVFRKLYLTFHGWEGHIPISWRAKLQRWVWAQVARGSLHIGGYIQDFYWDKPTLTSSGGVESPRLSQKNKLKTNLSAAPKLVFLGRLESENCVTSYIELFRQLRKVWPQASIVWVGDGRYRAECEKYGRVTGMIAETSSWLQRSDIVLASSYLSMLEAMASGKLVIALYDNPIKKRLLETFSGYHYILCGRQPGRMVQRLRQLRRQPRRWQHAVTTARQFAQTQTWAAVAETYLQLWHSSL